MKKNRARPLVGLSAYGLTDGDRYNLPAVYVDAVRRAGGCAVLLPPGDEDWREALPLLDALVLTGGGDINPERYRGARHETIYNLDEARDASEFALADAVLDGDGDLPNHGDLPTLGICRGAQVLNIAAGGTLFEHLPDHYGDTVAHRAPPREPVAHAVTVDATSKLHAVLGSLHFTCQSWHHQALREIPPVFKPVAWAPDGAVEAIESPARRFLMAVQWHPELTAAEDAVQQNLFDALVNAAR